MKIKAHLKDNIAPLVFGNILLIVFILNFIKGSMDFMPMTLMILLNVLFIVWIFSFQIELFDDKIVYRSLLGGEKVIRFLDISRVRREIGYARYLDRLKPPLRLVVESKNLSIEINMKVFSRDNLNKLIEYLKARNIDVQDVQTDC